jgi:acylphosphatase
MKKTLRVCVFGKVQGVWFRESTRIRALELGLNGWVRNRPDSSVEALISGDPTVVDEMIAWLHIGPPHAEVNRVEIEEVLQPPPLTDFRVTL